MKTTLKALVSMLPLACGIPAEAAVSLYYSEEFAAAVGPEWSHTQTETSPIGLRRFLGQFGNDSVKLSLAAIPAHAQVRVSFDLFLIHTWDGSLAVDSNGNSVGPDLFRASIGNGIAETVVLNTTFSNTGYLQAYPDSFSSGITYPARTGAAESNSLGYDYFGDTIYNFTFLVNHSSSDLEVTFEGSGLQSIADEAWGIDNVRVHLDSVPEPGSSALLAMAGVFSLALRRRRRRTD